jgi:hypothetical protein
MAAEFNLLESLEDLVGQLQMGKCSDEDVLKILNNIVNYTQTEFAQKDIIVCDQCGLSDAMTYVDVYGIPITPICLHCN